MTIEGDIKKASFTEEQKDLFQAMKDGKTIKSVTCMAGTQNRGDRSKDFVVEDFVAHCYWQGMQGSSDGEAFDYVEVSGDRKNFYMNWVIKFEL
jgi:hypothetical protein